MTTVEPIGTPSPIDAPTIVVRNGDDFTASPTTRDGDPGTGQPHFARWWRIAPQESGILTLDTLASEFSGDYPDTQLYIYDAESMALVAFNDSAFIPPTPYLSKVSLRVSEGRTYFVQVGTYDDTGDDVDRYVLTGSMRAGAVTWVKVDWTQPALNGGVWKSSISDLGGAVTGPGDRAIIIAAGGSNPIAYPAGWDVVTYLSGQEAQGVVLTKVATDTDWWATGGAGLLPTITWDGGDSAYTLVIGLSGNLGFNLFDQFREGVAGSTIAASDRYARSVRVGDDKAIHFDFQRHPTGVVTVDQGDVVFTDSGFPDASLQVFESDPGSLTLTVPSHSGYFGVGIVPIPGASAPLLPTAMGAWIEPQALTPVPPDADALSIDEGDVCALEDGLMVVATIGSALYAVHLWAIDTNDAVPAVKGNVFNLGTLAGTTLPDGWDFDPRGTVIDNMSFCVATGPREFALLGRPYETYDSAGNISDTGDYVTAAQFFAVQDDLTIKRAKVCMVAADLPFSYTGSAAAWGKGAVVICSGTGSGSEAGIIIADHGGGAQHVLLPAYSGIDAGAVSGDDLLVVAYPDGVDATQIIRVSLPDGAVTGSVLVDNYETDSTFACTLTDGRVAFVVRLYGDDSFDGPLHVVVVDPQTMGASGPYPITSEAKNFGWTGGHFSNVRDVQPLPDGTLSVGYVTQEQFLMARVDPDNGNLLSIEQVSTFAPEVITAAASPAAVYVARQATLDDGRSGAVFVSYKSNDADHGVFASYHDPVVEAGLIGWWDSAAGIIQPLGSFPLYS